MLKRRCYIFIFALAFLLPLFPKAQNTNEKIKKAADSNKNGQSAGRSDDRRRYGSGSTDIFISLEIIAELAHYHNYLLRNEDSLQIRRITGTEAFFQFGAKPGDYYVFLPRIRGNWGLLSTDVRMYASFEQRIDFIDFYKTIDWQVLELNLLATRQFNLRFGTGVMRDTYAQRSFNESTIGFDYYAPDDLYKANAELRYARDYTTNTDVRVEFNYTLSRKIWKKDNMRLYATLGGLHARYYGIQNVWSIVTGLAFRID